MNIKKNLYLEILSYYHSDQSEQGGIIGKKSGTVCEYIHDEKPKNIYTSSYEPNINFLNEIILEWNRKGIEFAGIVHNHPYGHQTLSLGDMNYARLLFDCNPELKFTFFPIICGSRIIPFKIKRTDNRLDVIPEKVILIEKID